MSLKKFAVVSSFVGLVGCGGVETEEFVQTDSLKPRELNELKQTFRNATNIYHNTANLAANGWVQLQEACFEEDDGEVQLGIVYVRPAIIDATIDPNNPEVLYYEPQEDGSLVLMGGEYFCPIEACPTPPTLFGQTFRFEEDTNGHALHVWAWLNNPNGLTAAENPNVDTTYCP
jgi:hypothetical protein